MNVVKLRHKIAVIGLVLLVSGCSTLSHNPDSLTKESVADLFQLSVDAQRAYRESRWVDAVRLYQTLVEQVPTDASAWFHLANTYARQGAFQPAIHAYEESLRFDRTQHKAWFNLSSAYLLNAQSAMRQSSVLMNHADPARAMIADRLLVLEDLVNGRVQRSAQFDPLTPVQDLQAVQAGQTTR